MKTIEKDLLLENTYDITARLAGQRPLFIDIETTGLSPEHSHTYLVGCIKPLDREHWHFIQWLAQSPFEERELLRRVCDYIKDCSPLVHFNGDRFDLPYLQQRCEELGIEGDFLCKESLDLYKEFKKCKKLCGLPNGKQKTFEAFLGIDREDQYDGGRLIPVYHDYVYSGRTDLEHLLLIHNEEDVIGMTKLLPMFYYVELLSGQEQLLAGGPLLFSSPFRQEALRDWFSPRAPFPSKPDGPDKIRNSELLLSFPLRRCYPSRLSFHTMEGWYGILSANTLRLKIPACQGELRYYLPNPKDYYYLPAEDTAIHRSVGEYVDKSYRRPATAKNCYIKKTGSFFLLPEAGAAPVFYPDDRKTPFQEWTDELSANTAFWEGYLRQIFLRAAKN